MTDAELWTLYALMLKSRLFEEAVSKLWHDGLISGEMHLGTGEEAIMAGIVSQLTSGDAMAADHRGTAAFLMRGVDPALLLREMLGREDGLCRGQGGHMHLFSKEHLAASSGIVGAGGPAAAGFALAAQILRPGSVAVAFFGDGAMNQGMLMESINLAAAWTLPVIFVCKDDGWAITTQSGKLSGGTIKTRVQGLGIEPVEVDGTDVMAVKETARTAIEHARAGLGPAFLHARCVHLEGHFLGFQLLKIARDPLKEMPEIAVPLTRSFLKSGGAGLRGRADGLKEVLSVVLAALRDPRKDSAQDPVLCARNILNSEPGRLHEMEDGIKAQIGRIIESALNGAAA